jgi:predicted DNA-binding transcriptional regulator
LSDKSLGIMIILLSFLVMFGYFIWAFAPILGLSTFISRDLSEWAFKLPVVLAIYALLVIILWIGYTMATTPPPLPLEKPLEIEREEASGIEEGKDKEEKCPS